MKSMTGRLNAEDHAYHKYVNRKTVPSRYIPNETITFDESMRCPTCGKTLPLIEHGHRQDCQNCGLKMEVHGNCLTIWK